MFTDWFKQPRGIVGRASIFFFQNFTGAVPKRGAVLRKVINFPSEFGSKRGVRIIRRCGLYAVKDSICKFSFNNSGPNNVRCFLNPVYKTLQDNNHKTKQMPNNNKWNSLAEHSVIRGKNNKKDEKMTKKN